MVDENIKLLGEAVVRTAAYDYQKGKTNALNEIKESLWNGLYPDEVIDDIKREIDNGTKVSVSTTK